jgi:hypothetical protein
MNERWPTFLVIGAGRSGTSSLYAYLKQHPEIYMSPVKEPRFFASSEEGVGKLDGQNKECMRKEEYLKLFNQVSNEKQWGEASPTYLHDETSPQRISATIPDVKLIAILRNPVERAYSHYGLNVRLGRREEGKFGRWIRNVEPGDSFWEKYIVPGFYYKQLSRYYEFFGEGQVSIYLFKEFTEETERVVTDIFDFLGVDSSFNPNLSVERNASGIPRLRLLYRLMDGSREPATTLKRVLPASLKRFLVKLRDSLLQDRGEMDFETRQCLRTIYRDDISKLHNLIGQELDHWE